jgi:hypothetical protein
MSTINLATFRELLKTELPRLLRENPQARHEIWGLMLESFPSRQEFTALLEELRTFREDSNRRFEQQAAELRDFRAEMYTFREDTHQRFEAIDHRFDTVDQRFDAVDRRFDAVDQRFDTVDRRFDAVDQRFEVVDQRFDSLESRMEAGFQELRQAIDRLGSRWGIRNESLFRQTIAALLEQSFGAQVQSRFIDGEQFDVIITDGAHILVEITASAGPKIHESLERKRRLYTEATGVAPARVLLATAAIHSQRAQALRAAGFEVIEPEEEALE